MFSRAYCNIYKIKVICHRSINPTYRSLSSLNFFTPEHDEMRKTINKVKPIFYKNKCNIMLLVYYIIL